MPFGHTSKGFHHHGHSNRCIRIHRMIEKFVFPSYGDLLKRLYFIQDDVTTMIMIIRMNTHRRVVSHQTCAHNEHKLKPCIYALCPDDGLICRTHVRTYTIVRMALNSIDDLKDGQMSPPPLRAGSDNFVCVSFIGRQLDLDCSTISCDCVLL